MKRTREEIEQMNKQRVSARRAKQQAEVLAGEWLPEFSHYRHGGWYVTNVVYPTGAIGCVAKNQQSKWTLVCGSGKATFATRTEAALYELALVLAMPDAE